MRVTVYLHRPWQRLCVYWYSECECCMYNERIELCIVTYWSLNKSNESQINSRMHSNEVLTVAITCLEMRSCCRVSSLPSITVGSQLDHSWITVGSQLDHTIFSRRCICSHLMFRRCTAWNAQPTHATEASSVFAFKTTLDSHWGIALVCTNTSSDASHWHVTLLERWNGQQAGENVADACNKLVAYLIMKRTN